MRPGDECALKPARGIFNQMLLTNGEGDQCDNFLANSKGRVTNAFWKGAEVKTIAGS
jgi:hypothetical protein